MSMPVIKAQRHGQPVARIAGQDTSARHAARAQDGRTAAGRVRPTPGVRAGQPDEGRALPPSPLNWSTTRRAKRHRARAGQIALRLTRADLAILDEPGYPPFTPSGGALFST